MTPRPRNKKTAGLPPNLYPRNGGKTYIYRRPDDRTWHGMGSDKTKAIQAAKQLNSLLMAGDSLVETVMGSGQKLCDFVDYYEHEVLPHRDWAKATMDLFKVAKRRINKVLGNLPIDAITIKDCADMLDPMPARSSNQVRQRLIDIFIHAAAKGLIVDNPAASTIARIEKVQRKRHTIEGLKKIRDAAELWMQNAIDLALITAQRREDIVAIRFDDERDDGLYVTQIKTEKHSDAGWIRFELTPQLRAVIARCRDDTISPFLIHRRPERLPAKDKQNKAHWTAIAPEYVSRAFKEARDAAKPYPGLSDKEQPGFHQIRALSLYLYKRAGKKMEQRKQIAGHSHEKMTKNYEAGHEDIVWTHAVADLDIETIFAQ